MHQLIWTTLGQHFTSGMETLLVWIVWWFNWFLKGVWEGYFSGHARSSSGKAWDAANKQPRLRFHVRNRPCMCRQQWANRQITKKIMFNFIVSTETCIFQICSLTHWLLTYWLIWLIKHPFSSVRFDISLQNFKKPLFDISPRTERKKNFPKNIYL